MLFNSQRRRLFTAVAEAAFSRAVPAQSVILPLNPQQKYQFDERSDRVGQGLFANVFKALDVQSQSHVAIKSMKKSTCPECVFKQEVKVMNQIRSLLGENTALSLHTDEFDSDDQVCLVFPFFSGGEMYDEVVENGAFSEEEAKTFMKRIVPALKSLHESGFVHRDIKLENILLSEGSTRQDRLKTAALTDFGYAKHLSDKDSFSNPAGTFGYVAPEVLSTRKYTSACDVWSLGAVLFSSIAGYQPFPLKTELKESSSMHEEAAAELEAIRHGTSEESWSAEMSKEKFSNCSPELKDLLKQMLEPISTRRISADEILSHPWMTS